MQPQAPISSRILASEWPAAQPAPTPTTRPVTWPGTTSPAGAEAGEAYVSDSGIHSTPPLPPGGFTYPQTAAPGPSVPVSQSNTPVPGRSALSPGVREAQIDAGPAVVAELKPCEGAQPLATVGREWILAAEVMGVVNELLAQHQDKLAKLPPEAIEQERMRVAQAMLQRRIETKLVYLDAKRTIPAENMPRIEENIGKDFDKNVVPAMVKQAKLGSRQELEAKLRSYGTSLDHQKRSYIEQEIYKGWIGEKIKNNDEISREEIWAYYQEHLKDYEFPARARWEQLMVRVSDFPGKAEAWAAIANAGNQVQAGAPFAEVAKARSKGPTASEGGLRDWTRQGSLRSQVLDAAIFALPVGQLSRILEDGDDLHIVRVLERNDSGRTSFEESQAEIRDKIRQQRSRKRLEDYLARLREEIPVRTIFDDGNPQSSMAGQPGPLPR